MSAQIANVRIITLVTADQRDEIKRRTVAAKADSVSDYMRQRALNGPTLSGNGDVALGSAEAAEIVKVLKGSLKRTLSLIDDADDALDAALSRTVDFSAARESQVRKKAFKEFEKYFAGQIA